MKKKKQEKNEEKEILRALSHQTEGEEERVEKILSLFIARQIKLFIQG